MNSSHDTTETPSSPEILLVGEGPEDLVCCLADAFEHVEKHELSVETLQTTPWMYANMRKHTRDILDIEDHAKLLGTNIMGTLWGATILCKKGQPLDQIVLRSSDREFLFRVCTISKDTDLAVLSAAIELLPEPTLRTLSKKVSNLLASAKTRAKEGFHDDVLQNNEVLRTLSDCVKHVKNESSRKVVLELLKEAQEFVSSTGSKENK